MQAAFTGGQPKQHSGDSIGGCKGGEGGKDKGKGVGGWKGGGMSTSMDQSLRLLLKSE